MKKTIALILTFLLAATSFTACDKDIGKKPADDTETVVNEQIDIGKSSDEERKESIGKDAINEDSISKDSDEEKIMALLNGEINNGGSILDQAEKSLVIWNYLTESDAKKAREEYRRILEKNTPSGIFVNVDKPYIVDDLDISGSTATVTVSLPGSTTTDSNVGYAEIDEETFIRVHGIDVDTAKDNNTFEEFSNMYLEAWLEAVKNDRLDFSISRHKYTLEKSGNEWEVVSFDIV